MPERKTVAIAEIAVGEAGDILVAYGLGSCVAIALADTIAGIGALAHTLLPAPLEKDRPSAKFAATAVELMLAELRKRNCDPSRVVAKLAGGATMFDALFLSPAGTIGERNVAAAREALARHGIPVVGEETGGNIGRTVEFHPETAELVVTSMRRTPHTV